MRDAPFQPSMCTCAGIEHDPACSYYAIQEEMRIKGAQERSAAEDAPPKPDDGKYAAARAQQMGIPSDQIAAFVLGWKMGSRR